MNRFALRAAVVACVFDLAACSNQPATPAKSSGTTAPQRSITNVAPDAIAYVVADGNGKARRFQLVVADPNGDDANVVVTSSEPLLSPTWSPDGSQLAYAGFFQRTAAIFVVDLRTRASRVVTHEVGVNSAPAWSPDGKSLALSLSFGSNADIYIIDLASSTRRRLTTNPAIDTEPAWSPDGREIAFTSDRSGAAQIYAVPSWGGQARRLNIAGKQNMRPAYSPDGNQLALVHYEGSRSLIGLLDLRNQVFRTVSGGPMDESPTFAPDGLSLAYVDTRAHQLAVVGVDSRGMRILPLDGDVLEVAWR
ncbi:MAG TPA: DPP IV N-terminal domain-containing protein [Nevskiaceae bacterium]|nr:DPP IV N-terminal domain-containing protein [Nevskiaceae bacterium]